MAKLPLNFIIFSTFIGSRQACDTNQRFTASAAPPASQVFPPRQAGRIEHASDLVRVSVTYVFLAPMLPHRQGFAEHAEACNPVLARLSNSRTSDTVKTF